MAGRRTLRVFAWKARVCQAWYGPPVCCGLVRQLVSITGSVWRAVGRALAPLIASLYRSVGSNWWQLKRPFVRVARYFHPFFSVRLSAWHAMCACLCVVYKYSKCSGEISESKALDWVWEGEIWVLSIQGMNRDVLFAWCRCTCGFVALPVGVAPLTETCWASSGITSILAYTYIVSTKAIGMDGTGRWCSMCWCNSLWCVCT